MPLLVNKLVYGLVPDRAPFILRPILRPVFKKLQDAFVDPRLKKQSDFVSPPSRRPNTILLIVCTR